MAGLGDPREESRRISTPGAVPENVLSLSAFRTEIFHYGVKNALERAQGRGETLSDLARGFESSYKWTENPLERGEVIKLFEGQLSSLEALAEKLHSEPTLPVSKSSLFSFGLRVFPVAENEWNQVEWPMTSDVGEFSKAVGDIGTLMKASEFVLPQGGYYIPAHFRIETDDRGSAAARGSNNPISSLAIELFLPCVTAERATHALHSGYTQFYSHETSARGMFRGGSHELVIRVPALWSEMKPSWFILAGLEIHECLKDHDPTGRASGILSRISNAVSEFSSGEYLSVKEYVLNRPYTSISEEFADLRRAIFREMDFIL